MQRENVQNRRKPINGDRIFTLVIGILLALFFIVELYPMIYVLSASFSDPTMVAGGQMLLLPVKPTVDGYRYIFQYREIWTSYANTLFYTFFGTLVNLAVTLPAAYALSRRDFRDKGFFMVLFMFTMYFSGGLIPTYLNFKDLGLLNTRAIMLISGGLSVYNMIIARTFFANTIPWEMHEAARIDGANDFQTFFKIVLPLSKPIVVVLILYYGVGHWNSYFAEMIYLSKARDLWPLQLILREILIKSTFAQNAIAEGSVSAEEMKYLLHQADIANMLKYCVIIVLTIPMLVIYPFIQKFFAKGIMIGSVKG